MQRFIWIHYWPALGAASHLFWWLSEAPPPRINKTGVKAGAFQCMLKGCLAIFICMFSAHVMSHQICLHVCKCMYVCIYIDIMFEPYKIPRPFTMYNLQKEYRPVHNLTIPQASRNNYYTYKLHTSHMYIYIHITLSPTPSTIFTNKIPPRFCIRSGKGGEGEIHTERTR